MITARFPLYNKDGEIGYFDYGACLYPQGQLSEQNYFFNEEGIEKISFTSYKSEKEDNLRKALLKEVKSISYPKFDVPDLIK